MSRNDSTELQALADKVAQGFRAGKITFAQLAQLTAAEMHAIQRQAEKAWRAGKPKQAIAIYGLLVSCDPMNALYWFRAGQLQERVSEPAVALSCYIACELLGYDADRAQARQQRCLQKLGCDDWSGLAAQTESLPTDIHQ